MVTFLGSQLRFLCATTWLIGQTHWRQSEKPLAVAIALAQQGAEFLLKAKISSVSPFLLINGEISKWPKSCDKEDKSFADFKTIDAQDLIRTHDTVLHPRLPDKFKQEFEGLRKLRNTAMHSVDMRQRFTVKDAVKAILQISDTLIGSRRWLALLRAFCNERVDVPAAIGHDSYRLWKIAEETKHVFELLQPNEVAEFYDFSPKQRQYRCPYCEVNCEDFHIRVPLAQLRPNEPTSTTVYCLACDETLVVIRRPCSDESCKGNVFLKNSIDVLLVGATIDLISRSPLRNDCVSSGRPAKDS